MLYFYIPDFLEILDFNKSNLDVYVPAEVMDSANVLVASQSFVVLNGAMPIVASLSDICIWLKWWNIGSICPLTGIIFM